MKFTLGDRIAAGLAALAFFAEGIGTQVMGLAVPMILRDWHVPRAALAAPTALGLVGFAAGGIVGGLAGDRYGRFAALSGSLLLLGVGTVACGLCGDPAQLAVARVIAGLGLGASLPIAAAVIAERAPVTARSWAVAVGLAFLPLGGFAAGFMASVILPILGWRGLFVVAGLVGLILAAIVFALSRFGSSMEPDRTSLLGRPNASFPLLVSIFAGDKRRDTLALWGAFFFTVLIYYTVFSWAPAAFAAQGFAIAVASRVMAGFSMGGLIGGLLAGALAHRWGSRATLWTLGCAALASSAVLPHLAQGGPAGALALAADIVLLGMSVIGLQTLLYALATYVYDAAQRTTGIGLAVSAGRIGAIASSYTGVTALDRAGITGFFGTIILAALLAALCGLLVVRQIPQLHQS